MPYLMYFPDELLTLQQELADHHPKLMRQLMSLPDQGLDSKLAEIAAWCGVICDGYYVGKELRGLCALLTAKLVESRTTIVLLH